VASPDWRQKVISGPSARGNFGMAYDSVRQRTVLFGGVSTTNLGDTWEYDGLAWVQRFPTTSPAARQGHAMAYDPVRQRTVLFGGTVGGAETWEWNGTTWTQRFPTTSPPSRQYHRLAYHSGRGGVILTAGEGASGRLGDTWLWNGTTWTNLSTFVPVRRLFAMGFDSSRSLAVVFGGSGTSGVNLNDTHTLGAATGWTSAGGGTPPAPRNATRMAFDSARNVMVLFGGSDINGWPSLTAEYSATGWRTVTPLTQPPGRTTHEMVFDSARGQIVMFGGGNGSGSTLGDTWEFGP
jgi:hypothetical protein